MVLDNYNPYAEYALQFENNCKVDVFKVADKEKDSTLAQILMLKTMQIISLQFN